MSIDARAMLRPLAAAAILAAPVSASAQYAADPRFEWTLLESQATGIEMIESRLSLTEVFEQPYDEDLVELFEAMPEEFYPRFGGTLASRDPELAAGLLEALEEIVEAAEGEGDPAPHVAEARALLARAADVLIPSEVAEAPTFRGALLVELLLRDDGVAEAFEDAVADELWEFPSGWAALQRVDLLWAEIEPLASDEHRTDAQEMLAALHALFPDPAPPESMIGIDPEEAEAPAQRLAGIVEVVVDAYLFPGRDLPRLAGHLAALASEACETYGAGDPAVATEAIIAVNDFYRRNLRRTAGLFAAEAHETVTEHLEELIEAEEGDAGPRCVELSEALVEIQRALGG